MTIIWTARPLLELRTHEVRGWMEWKLLTASKRGTLQVVGLLEIIQRVSSSWTRETRPRNTQDLVGVLRTLIHVMHKTRVGDRVLKLMHVWNRSTNLRITEIVDGEISELLLLRWSRVWEEIGM